jgi:phosphoglycolate phosphatase
MKIRCLKACTPLLEELVGQGRQLFIATSKPQIYAREIARHFDFARTLT